uniref:Reverse transcriptase zinc-binding domain-containing protein n=1 Tax=Brassica oleracea var. oleracea TaxID=109376 RepID=A0A0D3DR28_BRAOL
MDRGQARSAVLVCRQAQIDPTSLPGFHGLLLSAAGVRGSSISDSTSLPIIYGQGREERRSTARSSPLLTLGTLFELAISRLSTGTRMKVWGIMQGCPFCAPSPDWAEILARILGATRDRLASILLRLALQVTVYYVWRERNERRHTQRSRPASAPDQLAHQLAKMIEKTIRQRVLSTRYYYEKKGLLGLMQLWFSTRINTIKV